MTKNSLILACCCLLLVLGRGVAARDSSADSSKNAERLRHAIEELRHQQQRLKGQRGQLDQALAELDRRIGTIAQRLRELQTERRALDRRLRLLKKQQQKKRREVAALRRELAALVRGAYLAGREERLKLLLNQEDPARISRVLAYHDYLSRTRAEKLRALQDGLKELIRLSSELEEKQRQRRRVAEQLDQERRSLRAQKKQQKRLLANIDKQLRQGDLRLKRMQEDMRRLESVVQESARALQALGAPEQKPFRVRRGRLHWPLAGRIAVHFGAHKIGSLRWEGVIIKAPEGRAVKAVHGGRVAYADWLRGYGLLLIIDHGDGYTTLYGHNQSLLKEVGDWVEEGETIGFAGRSGGFSYPGIYFGIRHAGKPVNPVKWCRRPKGSKTG